MNINFHGRIRTDDPWITTKYVLSTALTCDVNSEATVGKAFWTTPVIWWPESNRRPSGYKPDVLTTTKDSSPTALTLIIVQRTTRCRRGRCMEHQGFNPFIVGRRQLLWTPWIHQKNEVSPHCGNRHLASPQISKNTLFVLSGAKLAVVYAIFLRIRIFFTILLKKWLSA